MLPRTTKPLWKLLGTRLLLATAVLLATASISSAQTTYPAAREPWIKRYIPKGGIRIRYPKEKRSLPLEKKLQKKRPYSLQQTIARKKNRSPSLRSLNQFNYSRHHAATSSIPIHKP